MTASIFSMSFDWAWGFSCQKEGMKVKYSETYCSHCQLCMFFVSVAIALVLLTYPIPTIRVPNNGTM
jgi:hypothetical protein